MGQRRGFGILEIIISLSIISFTLFSLVGVFILASRLEAQTGNKVRANFLAEEGVEVLRFLRDQSWSGNLSSLSPVSTYYLSFFATSSAWSVGVVPQGLADNLFLRSVTVESVSRDPATSNIEFVYNSSNDDPSTKKFNVVVAWRERGATSTVSVSTYLMNVFGN